MKINFRSNLLSESNIRFAACWTYYLHLLDIKENIAKLGLNSFRISYEGVDLIRNRILLQKNIFKIKYLKKNSFSLISFQFSLSPYILVGFQIALKAKYTPGFVKFEGVELRRVQNYVENF